MSVEDAAELQRAYVEQRRAWASDPDNQLIPYPQPQSGENPEA